MAAVLFLACIVAIVVINQNTQKEIFWENKQDELALITSKCRSDTETWAEETAQLLMATTTALAMHTPANDGDYTEDLQAFVDLDEDVLSIYVGYETGEFHASADIGVENPDYQSRGWYKLAMESDGSVLFTEPYIDNITGGLVVSLVKKVTNEQGDQGVAGMDISLARLNAMIGSLSVSENGGAYLVSAEGKVMTYIDPQFTPKIENGEAVFLEAQDVLAQVSVLEDIYTYEDADIHVQQIIDYDGVEKYEAVTPVPRTGWTLGVNIPLSDYDDEVNAVVMAQWPVLLLAFFMSLICIYVASILMLRERRRLKAQELLTIELNQKNAQLSNLTNHDPLTGVYNRRYLIAYLEEKLGAYVPGRPACVLMFDLDYFKNVNDEYGHGMGDEVLKSITESIGDALRSNDVLARLGGEEFIAVIDRAHADQAYQAAERIREQIEALTIKGKVGITVSIGVAELRKGETVDSLLDRVDVCLYTAKNSGRNCTVVDQDDIAALSGGGKEV